MESTAKSPADESPVDRSSTAERTPFQDRVFLGLIVAGVLLAWFARFVQDDAFISFIYARNLAEGLGPTWFGERIEGYTNFLWMLWMSLGFRLGIEPVLFSQVSGIALFTLFLCLAFELGRRHGGDAVGRLTVLLLVGNVSVVSYATGGLETMLQAVLLTAALLLDRRPLALSIVLLLALMTRLDSAAIGFFIGCAALWRFRDDFRSLVALVLPVGLGVALWFGWKLWYYGDPLPNTFYAKVSGLNWVGFLFLYRFLHWYALWPFLLLALRGASGLGRLLALLLLWCAYVVWVGGDFMEFRFVIPVASLLMVVVASLMHRHLRAWPRRLGIALLIAASLLHGLRFRHVTPDRTLDSLTSLGTFYDTYAERPWSSIGGTLAENLEGLDVRIALHPVGAIPFYSRLDTIDMYGLNDAWVARNGDELGDGWVRPGHQRFAPWEYLLERQVDLVLGDVQLLESGSLGTPGATGAVRRLMISSRPTAKEPLPRARVVAMPLGDGQSLLMLQARPNPPLEERMVELGWELIDVQARPSQIPEAP
ncbi:MAG: hypothetical protein AAF690_09670 [Acidobacteriota bacterium]